MNKLLMMVVVILAATTFCTNGRGGLFAEYKVESLLHVVRHGETIWDIAEKYYHLEQKEQLGEFVWRIDRQNGKRRFIQPGQVVLVQYHIVKE